MAEQYNNKTVYSIPRSFKPIVYQTVTLVVVSDALLLFTLLLIVGFRNTVGVDSSMIGFSIVLFGFKAIITAYGVYKSMQSWLGVTYFVVNNQLYIQSDVRSVNSTVFHLKDITKAQADQAYRAHRKQAYGTVHLTFARGMQVDEYRLTGIKDPDGIARMLSLGGK